MRLARADRCNDTFADTGKDRCFTGTTNKTLDIRADRYTSNGRHLNTILCNGSNGRSLYDFWIDR